MPFKAGQSGNPNGRPPKKRALTVLLESAGDKTIPADGKRVARKRILADLAWQLTTEGEAVLPNGKRLELAPKDWIDLYKWIYTHIDGAAKQEIDVTSDGEPLTFDYGKLIRSITPRPIEDSDAPGQD